MTATARKRLRPAVLPVAVVAGVTGVLLAIFPTGFPNYDTVYALLWGRELADLSSPSQSAPLAPTPHPLLELAGAIASPLGDGAATVVVILAYVSLGLIAYLVYRLGEMWFDRPIGALAAFFVLTRAPFLSNGLRAYVDLPYIALCLGALAIETRRPRSGRPVLALLALAGLLRPEAWLFSFFYLGFLLVGVERREGMPVHSPSAWRVSRRPGPAGHDLGILIALAVAAPALWALFDLITTGNPAYSFTGTRETVDALERQSGPFDLVLYGPRRLGEVLQWPGMVGAAAGVALGLGLLRRRVTTGVVAALLALAGFAILACAGLAIIPRYTMLAASVLVIFAAAALLGWRLVEQANPWRRRWQIVAGVIALMFVVWIPNQYDLLSRVDTDLSNQALIEDDLHDLVTSDAFDPLCGPVSVPNHRAVPRLAFWLDVGPYDIVSSSEQAQPRTGYFLAPASRFVIENFVLDPNDPTRLDTQPPEGFQPVADNRSWKLYSRC